MTANYQQKQYRGWRRNPIYSWPALYVHIPYYPTLLAPRKLVSVNVLILGSVGPAVRALKVNRKNSCPNGTRTKENYSKSGHFDASDYVDLEVLAATIFNKIFSGLQPRQGVKIPRCFRDWVCPHLQKIIWRWEQIQYVKRLDIFTLWREDFVQ